MVHNSTSKYPTPTPRCYPNKRHHRNDIPMVRISPLSHRRTLFYPYSPWGTDARVIGLCAGFSAAIDQYRPFIFLFGSYKLAWKTYGMCDTQSGVLRKIFVHHPNFLLHPRLSLILQQLINTITKYFRRNQFNWSS